MVTGGLAIGIPILNGLVTGQWFVTHLNTEHSVAAWVDTLMLLGGALTVFAATLATAERMDKKYRSAKLKPEGLTALSD